MDYCWIHGSSYIPQEYQVPGASTTPGVEIVTMLLQAHLKCIVEQEGVMSADEAPDTSYYQWVTFMFCLQVAATTASSQAVIQITFRRHSSISPTSCGLPWRVGFWPALALMERRR